MQRNLALSGAAGVLAVLAVAGAVLVPRLIAPSLVSATIGGSFQLTDSNGVAVTDANFRGKWMLVYFGYTHCPDACPTALQDLADTLGPAAAKVVPVFITVDPARDTPAVMKDYISAFGAGIVGLSGPQEAITQAETEYRVYAAKHPTGNGGYEMDHSSMIYIMDPQGRFAGTFASASSAKEMAEKLNQLGA
jgi:protein SCO1/2